VKRKKTKPKSIKSKMDGYIFGALRKIWRWHPGRKQALKKAEVLDSFGVLKEKCAYCCTLFDKNEVQVDHIDPVVDPKSGFVDWNTYIKRLLYVDGDTDLQVLCKQCHKKKTNKEGKIRRRNK
jgi:5-methylcytosine-specific restriction endonuclease McrA